MIAEAGDVETAFLTRRRSKAVKALVYGLNPDDQSYSV